MMGPKKDAKPPLEMCWTKTRNHTSYVMLLMCIKISLPRRNGNANKCHHSAPHTEKEVSIMPSVKTEITDDDNNKDTSLPNKVPTEEIFRKDEMPF